MIDHTANTWSMAYRSRSPNLIREGRARPVLSIRGHRAERFLGRLGRLMTGNPIKQGRADRLEILRAMIKRRKPPIAPKLDLLADGFTWDDSTEERFDDMLGALYPREWSRKITVEIFLLGEPIDYDPATGATRWQPHLRLGPEDHPDRLFFVGSRAITVAEFEEWVRKLK